MNKRCRHVGQRQAAAQQQVVWNLDRQKLRRAELFPFRHTLLAGPGGLRAIGMQ